MFGRRELALGRALLSQQAQTANAILNSVDKERLECLDEKERVRREHVKADRGKRVETQGLPAVRKVELARGRTVHSRKTEKYENDPAARALASKHNREMEEKRVEEGGDPKELGAGKNRKIKTKKKVYPPFFMDRLTLATRIWAREYGQEFVVWNDRIQVFGLSLIREQTALGGDDLTKDDKPKYLHFSYITAVEPVLEQCKEAKKKWRVRGYVQKATTRNEQTQDLFTRVVQLVYEE